MTLEQMYILQMLGGESMRTILSPKQKENHIENALSREQWNNIVDIVNRHAVLSLLYSKLEDCADIMPKSVWNHICQVSNRVVHTNYRLLFATRYLTDLLEKNDVPVVVLKGAVTGYYYPKFELRKSGDIDLLVSKDMLPLASQLLVKEGYVRKTDSHSVHHVEFQTSEGIVIELHSMMIEPVENRKIDQQIREIEREGLQKRIRVSIMGVNLPTLSEPYHAYYLIMHMLHHYLRKGFGIKLLYDWGMFWRTEHTEDTKQQLREMLEKSGLITFVRTITGICVNKLGLPEHQVDFLEIDRTETEDMELLLQEIWEAEEFGESTKERMVAVKGTTLRALFKEFHHQMRLNYSTVSRCVLLWPVLWIMTLVGFHHNNRTLRGVSTRAVLQNAKERSTLRSHMKIFEQ